MLDLYYFLGETFEEFWILYIFLRLSTEYRSNKSVYHFQQINTMYLQQIISVSFSFSVKYKYLSYMMYEKRSCRWFGKTLNIFPFLFCYVKKERLSVLVFWNKPHQKIQNLFFIFAAYSGWMYYIRISHYLLWKILCLQRSLIELSFESL